jgi:5-methyltetrahydrofolate--homocysteine methyltransferase
LRTLRVVLVDEVVSARRHHFDPNIFATGIEEHNNYAVWLRSHALDQANLPGAKVSGGVSTCPSVFAATTRCAKPSHRILYHAIQAGMDMGIVNAGMVGVYDDSSLLASGLKTVLNQPSGLQRR